jgi:hypothetical protein
LAAPQALVEVKTDFDKNPRLASGRGFFVTHPRQAGHKPKNYEQNYAC